MDSVTGGKCKYCNRQIVNDNLLFKSSALDMVADHQSQCYDNPKNTIYKYN